MSLHHIQMSCGADIREDGGVSAQRRQVAAPGRRSGEGSASLLPYLLHSLATKLIAAPPNVLQRPARGGTE
jgi:hypothetical protein